MERERLRLRAGVVGMALTLLVAGAGTAAWSLSGRRSNAAAGAPELVAATRVVLRAALSVPRVTYGTGVTVTGSVADPDGVPLAGRPVEVVAVAARPGVAPAVVATAVSDRSGKVSATFRPRAGSDVWLRSAAADGFAEATSEPVPVRVAPKVTVATSAVRTARGWTVALRGTVTPAPAGAGVHLYRKVGGGWRPVSAGQLSVAGQYSFTVRSDRAGTQTYRVARPAEAPYEAAAAVGSVWIVPSAPPVRRASGVSGPGGPGRLLVAGDSFAYYLGQQLTAQRRPRATVIESRHSSGLTRPDFFDWAAAARRGAASRPGAVVVFLGANDCQPVRVGGTGRWVSLGTPAWVAEYRRRAAEVMWTYGGNAARPVYWVGLPIVREADIAACYRAINAATAGAAAATAGVTWIDSWSVYAVNGRYSERVDGVVARQEDGIHLTFEGTRLLTRKVYALLGA